MRLLYAAQPTTRPSTTEHHATPRNTARQNTTSALPGTARRHAPPLGPAPLHLAQHNPTQPTTNQPNTPHSNTRPHSTSQPDCQVLPKPEPISWRKRCGECGGSRQPQIRHQNQTHRNPSNSFFSTFEMFNDAARARHVATRKPPR